ncbi:MAG TPA: ATP-binding cassette domain-containing protein, partial [Ktedonobacteraceae bacterium]|nr:ATP-binding cassette domain-containing protein [Ktedonobacteraceae bacterium]
MSQVSPLLQIEHVKKSFPGVQALVDANLTIQHNEIHALVGQNGAGKSTLIKILTGAYHRDSGTILFDGSAIDFNAPQQAQNNGISTIYQ